MSATEPHFEQYTSAEKLERYLGDPSQPANVFSFTNSIELDEMDEYPQAACDLLNEWGFQLYYVPEEYGGRLRSFDEFISLIRVISRRDLTVAVAHVKTYLGAVAVWVAGSDEQRQTAARIIRNGEQVALGLTERGHGSDVLSSEVRAERTADGYLLSGEKWLINNATRSTAMTLFARTSDGGGPRGFSLFFLEKPKMNNSSFAHLPRVKTHGLRGADISGIRLEGCGVDSNALIRSAGSGLEVSLKMLQVTRSIVPALSLGAADTALRATMSFAVGRKLYGDSVFAIPSARRMLVNAFVDLLTCECLTVAVARAVHVLPRQMSILSAVAKYYVPTTVEEVVRSLSVVLGARYYLREGHWSGIFQKIVRDNAIASLFDGSTVVNLNAIALQLRSLAEHHQQTQSRARDERDSSLERVFALAEELPVFRPDQLELHNRGADDLLQGLESSLDRLRDMTKATDDNTARETVISLTEALVEEINRTYATLRQFTPEKYRAMDKSTELFALAKRYCALHAAASSVHIWIHNRSDANRFFGSGEWLALALSRLLASVDAAPAPIPKDYEAGVARRLEMLYRNNDLFSLFPYAVAQTTPET